MVKKIGVSLLFRALTNNYDKEILNEIFKQIIKRIIF